MGAGVLVASSALNAAYFLPVVFRMWFSDASEETGWAPSGGRKEGEEEPEESRFAARAIREPKALLLPALCTAYFTLALGLGASWAFSPLEVSRFIAEGCSADADARCLPPSAGRCGGHRLSGRCGSGWCAPGTPRDGDRCSADHCA
ncbi:hypothetical protein [Nesterenkonia pannonica]|uniref:hypothetical protein n=1 Tax=Nesterenkonia pannonica TaxID=1548602 RepID=UPI0021648A17|nr:hypothetical protein [Nesterenkonia pannonica]